MNKKSLTPIKPAHYIPFTKEDILSAFLSQLSGDEVNDAKTFFTLIKNQIHLEFHQTIEELDHHYAPLNPNIGDAVKSKETDSSAFIEQLEYTLTKANYKALGQTELNEALEAESLFKIRLHVDFSDYKKPYFSLEAKVFEKSRCTFFGVSSKERSSLKTTIAW